MKVPKMQDFRLNLELINELQKEISTLANHAQDINADIKDAARRLQYAAYEYDCAAVKLNPYLVKSVVKYIAKGFTEQNAVALTAKDYDVTLARVEVVYNSQKRYTGAIKLYARKYCVKMLRQAGFKMCDIAKILKISEAHAYRLDKSVCPVDN